jgi:hypothetical protein
LVASAKNATPSVATYVIGVFSASEITRARPLLDTGAAFGGTGQAFVLFESTDLSRQLHS